MNVRDYELEFHHWMCGPRRVSGQASSTTRGLTEPYSFGSQILVRMHFVT